MVALGEPMDMGEAAALRKPFPDSAIGRLPKGGAQLAYVGHAAVTDRLLEVDRFWNWEPVAWTQNGFPLWTADAGNAVMWIRLTVCGVTRLGVGIVKDTAFELEKQLISDALRNAAMRFGVALDLWSKEDLNAENAGEQTGTAAPLTARTSSEASPDREPDLPGSGSPATSFVPGKATLQSFTSRCSSLAAIGVNILEARQAKKLPPVNKIREEWQVAEWESLLIALELEADKEAQSATG